MLERANYILQNPFYRENIEKNRVAEADRCFCHHDMAHFLDVARIGRIICLEEEIEIPLDILYAAALLHDCGRHEEYEFGIPHHLTSAEIAPVILRKCGYTEAEIEQIEDAIRNHRNSKVEEEKNLRGVLYRADKASRACFSCQAEGECDWSKEKKNLEISY
ncbi:MAG: HD domain-containing protein [Acetatifactor sp.]|nr:HD domain-containing protein [Acetatifactor sp.]